MTSTIAPLSIIETANMFDALSHPRRLRAIRVLDDFDASLALKDLAVETVRSERSESQEEVDTEQAEAVHIALHHCHVPKLADAGLVEYDNTEKRVAIAESAPLDAMKALGQ